ncbi:futalosine hydrolase [Dactylosporangium siamense]|uniref:Futalosine hydrolase n=1 Tax=Dactylosporangium siamense TaxID=685454 RepID=A0A919UHI4_9ACTN|nr:futalosine hydrolase [Dactylosporangium siamense]GIG51640.1 Futalosine hydrolase [Dactylosporangium siamense]
MNPAAAARPAGTGLSALPGLPGFRRVLIVTAVEPERAAVLTGLGLAPDDQPRVGAVGPDSVLVVAGGVGPADAAAATARVLTRAECEGSPFDAVLSAGIGGAFPGRADIGGLILGSLSAAGDLGAEDGDGFIDLERLGFGRSRHAVDPLLLRLLRQALPSAAVGPVVTVSTATGSAARTDALRRRVHDATAEGMEGFGVAVAASAAGTPFGELRAVSNEVGPRDRSAWRIPQALGALRDAFAVLATAS